MDWESRRVLYPGKPLFFDGGHQLTIVENRGRSITVIGVNAQYLHPLLLV
jgi:hypothetical protein